MQPGISPLHVIGIAGSLRSHSFNRGLLRAAQDVAPAGVQVAIMDVASIPFYNADVEAQGDPAPVAQLKSAVERADVLLITVAEYNYGMSGVLKNTIDWLSRPPDHSVLHGKPAAPLGRLSWDGRHDPRAAPTAADLCLYPDPGDAAATGGTGGPAEV